MSGSPNADVPGVSLDELARRRTCVREALHGGTMVLGAGSPSGARGASRGRFRPESDFLYLTGFREPGSVAVLRAGPEAPFTLFVPPRDPEREIWDGRRAGPDGARERCGADEAYPLGELATKLPDLLDGAEPLYFAPWNDLVLDRAVRRATAWLRGQERLGRRAPDALVDPSRILHEMRLVKTAPELALMERAAEITSRGHIAGMARCRPGASEFQVQAAIEHAFLDAGANGPGYATIVGAGANGTVLHYTENRGRIGEKDLVLVDAGAEYGGYTADITRTFPAAGRFEDAQLELYRVVLDAQEEAIASVRPGATIDGIHEQVIRTLTAGLVALGLLDGAIDDLIETAAFKKYYMHRTSHWLGMDVHDAGRYRTGGTSRPLSPGMVLTVEPGLYVPEDDGAAPDALRGLAVRIEDDVVVTAEGHRILTRSVPVDPAEIGRLVGASGAP
ncbi:MAG: aminopeptidase P N-terminal domain-containing protein [Acidobacteriota bacterium]|nr:aminopeptidase P N-terminal domain-containing protein [Acidobacteriota bacterium]